MKNYYFFNNQDLNRNKHLINYSNLSECPKKNSHYFIKPFTRLEIPNLNKLSSNKNIFISTEESTIITTEDIHKINKNDCKCICHELDKKIIIFLIIFFKLKQNIIIFKDYIKVLIILTK